MLKLYDYYRSSASFRVRIALNLKLLEYELVHIHLLKEGGQHLKKSYRQINPQGLVPTLEDTEKNIALNQSLAIIEYLEEAYPQPEILPQDPVLRAKARAIGQMIACEIHPLNNLRVLNYLSANFNATEEKKSLWYHHWLKEGFDAIEKIFEQGREGPYAFGVRPTLADICLVPQVINAERYGFSLDPYPLIREVHKHCLQLNAFSDALPDNQPAAR